jgi:hypothetical protein
MAVLRLGEPAFGARDPLFLVLVRAADLLVGPGEKLGQ